MRKRKTQLNFLSHEKQKKKKWTIFIITFAVFLVLLFGVSAFLFMDSIDYNFNNLGQSNKQDSAEQESETTTQPPSLLLENSNVLLTIYDGKSELTGMYVFSLSKETKEITVMAIDIYTTYKNANFKTYFKDRGIAGLKSAVQEHFEIQIDRYIKQSETDLKKIVGKIGNVTVYVAQSIQHKDKQNSLYLEAGPQNLTGDLFLKYLHYVSNAEQEEAVVNLAATTLDALYRTSENHTLLNYLFNASDTDFSIVDNEKNGLIPMFVSLRASIKPKG